MHKYTQTHIVEGEDAGERMLPHEFNATWSHFTYAHTCCLAMHIHVRKQAHTQIHTQVKPFYESNVIFYTGEWEEKGEGMIKVAR